MPIANVDQAEHWNSSDDVGHWVTSQDQYDGLLEPFNEILVAGAAIERTDRVLDVGCGCGATSRAAARAAVEGRVHGVDLSRDMLARARELAGADGLTHVTYEEADAQVHPFGDTFDVVVSRFGIMFFSDPVAAFANLRHATTPDGRLAFVCWQPFSANEWLQVQARGLGQPHPPLADAAPGTPGMMAFADPDIPRRVLAGAGWRDIAIESRAVDLLIGGRGTIDSAVAFTRNGSLGRGLLADADESTRERAIASLRAAFESHVDDEGVRLGSAVWLVTARA
jgi:SAM-dependent methyltransferase